MNFKPKAGFETVTKAEPSSGHWNKLIF